MPSDDSLQTRVTIVVLAALDDAGFVLAGAGAIRAHGITARPTYDVDLFASTREVRRPDAHDHGDRTTYVRSPSVSTCGCVKSNTSSRNRQRM